jgi:DNA transformation protein and related proteins
MDATDIGELFAPLGRINLRRMFGGHGVYLNGRIFAIEANGMIWMKVDDANRPDFVARGSRPFTFEKKSGQVMATSYWALPDTAFDDPDELKVLAEGSLAAAARAEIRKHPVRNRRAAAARRPAVHTR